MEPTLDGVIDDLERLIEWHRMKVPTRAATQEEKDTFMWAYDLVERLEAAQRKLRKVRKMQEL